MDCVLRMQLEVTYSTGLAREGHFPPPPTIRSIMSMRDTNALFRGFLRAHILRPSLGISSMLQANDPHAWGHQAVGVNRRASPYREHIITPTCGVKCPRASDGLLFVPHQLDVIDKMKKLPSLPAPFAVGRVQAACCPALTLLQVCQRV